MKIPKDVERTYLYCYLSLADLWTLSTLNSEYHKKYKQEFFLEFKKRFYQRLDKIEVPPGMILRDLCCQPHWFTGSFLWSVLLDETGWVNQDVDIFTDYIIPSYEVPKRYFGIHVPSFHDINDPLNSGQWWYRFGWYTYQWHKGQRHVTNTITCQGIQVYNDRRKRVDIVYNTKYIETEECFDHFDIRGCASHFNGETLVIPDPHLTLFRKSHIDEHIDCRLKKYRGRGIEFV